MYKFLEYEIFGFDFICDVIVIFGYLDVIKEFKYDLIFLVRLE